MDRRAWWATVHGITRGGHDLVTKPPPPSLPCCNLLLLLKVSPFTIPSVFPSTLLCLSSLGSLHSSSILHSEKCHHQQRQSPLHEHT